MKNKTKESENEKRIYTVVAETVDTFNGPIVQIPGRIAAQAVHAVSRMKMHRMISETKRQNLTSEAWKKIAEESITTIILACRDNRELAHIEGLLSKGRIEHYKFFDVNEDVYGEGRICTALATIPILPERTEGILDYLPLWTPK